jgi:hypothetical protein
MTLESSPTYDKVGTVRPVNARQIFRAHPLDGAMLYFHPATGTHVRVATDATRELRRRAPRVAMFGITNHCNLHRRGFKSPPRCCKPLTLPGKSTPGGCRPTKPLLSARSVDVYETKYWRR